MSDLLFCECVGFTQGPNALAKKEITMTKSSHKSPVVNAPTDAAADTDAGTVWSVRGSGWRRTAWAAAGAVGRWSELAAWFGLVTPPAHPHP